MFTMKGLLLISCILLYINGVIPQFFGSPSYSLTKDPRFILFLPNNFLKPSATRPVCTLNSGRQGTCMSLLKCMFTKGDISGFCGFGTKACCDYKIVGSGTLRYIRGVFVNGNPASHSTLTIKRANNEYTQVRLNFRALTLEQPDSESNCVVNTITFTGQLSPPPFTLCGENAGQHVYLNFNGQTNIVITINPSTTSRWEIEALQLTNRDPLFAPSNCLQFFTTPTDSVKSFNYGTAVVPPSTTRQIANLDYNVCVANPGTWCSVTWNIVGPFSITGTANTGILIDNLCTTDYLHFGPNARFVDSTGQPVDALTGLFCGNTILLPASVKSTHGMVSGSRFIMRVVTNNVETPDVDNVGFSFTYAGSPTC